MQTAARAITAAHPEWLDNRPAWLKAVDGDPAYDWARAAWANAVRVPGAWYDHQLADHIVADWPNWATLTLDRFAGVKFKLNTWQELAVRLLVGWMIPTEIVDPETHAATTMHIRLFRRMLLWIPRKNGKSEFLAALALLFFVIDGVPQGEGFIFARKESQARIVFKRMTSMIANNEEFKAECIAYGKSIYVKPMAASFELLSGSVEGLHGKSPTVIVGDEMHEWRSLAIVETLRQGSVGRLQPIELYASTAGKKSQGVGEQLYEETRQIIDGRLDDPTTLAIIFAANDNDDPFDEATWRKANPNLGLAPTIHALRLEAKKAVGNPRALAHFKCYHLGIWIDEVVRWINLKKWDACAGAKDGWRKYRETLRGRKCFAAFDVSATVDVTALVYVFPPSDDDPKWRVLCRFWVPEDNVADRVAEGAPFDQFIEAGAMETTPGDYVDQNVLMDAILEGVREFDVQQIGYDRWNAAKLIADLEAAGVDAERLVEMRQGIRTMGEPSKHFERLFMAGVLDHGMHPVLRWMAGHVVVKFDDNLNFMPAKKRSREKIDGIVAAVMAVGLANRGEEPMDLDDFLANAVAA